MSRQHPTGPIVRTPNWLNCRSTAVCPDGQQADLAFGLQFCPDRQPGSIRIIRGPLHSVHSVAMSFFNRFSLSVLRRNGTMFSIGIPFLNRCNTTRPSAPSGPREEEPLTDYTRGGYYPINLGDVLQHRYKVVRKLGWGGYSTVWLAYDQRCATFEHRYI
jgi:hypothetical protein